MKLFSKHLRANIKTKVTLVTFLTFSLLFFTIFSSLFFYFHTLLKENIFKQQFVLASQIADQLNGRIELARNQLSLAATGIDREVLGNHYKLQQILVNASPANIIFDAGFLVIGPDGRVITESMGFPELIGNDLKFRNYVKEPLQTGKPVMSAPFQISVPPYSPMIAMVVPVRDNSDQIICLLAGYHTLGSDQFLTNLSPKHISSTSYLYLIQERTILMHPDTSKILETIPTGENLGIDQALQGFEGSRDVVDSKGEHTMSSFKKVGETGWLLVVNTPYDDAFKPLRVLSWNTFAISIFGITLSLLVVWYVTRRLTFPVSQLTAHVDKASAEGIDWQPIELYTGDEIGRLANAFNSLMDEMLNTKKLLISEKEFFSGIIQNAAAPMFVIDTNHTILFWNESLSKLTGKTASEMVNTKLQWSPFYVSQRPVLADFVIDNNLGQVNEVYTKSGKSLLVDGAYKAEGWYENINGQRRYLAFTAAPIWNGRNEIVAAIESFEDITELKLSQENMVQKQKELESTHIDLEHLFDQVEYAKKEWEQSLDHLRDFVILIDAEFRVRRYNKLLSDITGKSFSEISGENWRNLLDEAGFVFVSFDGTDGEVFHQNTQCTYDIHIYSIKDGEVITGYVVSMNDTTDLHTITQKLQKAYVELEEAQLQIFQQEKLASIGQLAAGVAHEINNPIGFISSNLRTLNKYLDRMTEYTAANEQARSNCNANNCAPLNEMRKKLKIDYVIDDAQQLISESLDGTDRVKRIVQDLKSFSRIDQTEHTLVNLNEALETTINIAWNEIKYVATLNKEFGDIPLVPCFPQQLNQVFLNLLVNASHALAEEHGTITVRTWSEDNNVFVSISDTGCGIPNEIQQRIFEPFFTTKEVGKGTGLGLSISYDIINKHGGDISVQSQVNFGTNFIVRLPSIGPNTDERNTVITGSDPR